LAFELGIGATAAATSPRAGLAYTLGDPSGLVTFAVTAGGGAQVEVGGSRGFGEVGGALDLVMFPWLDARVDIAFRVSQDGGTSVLVSVGPQAHTPRRFDRDGDLVPDDRDACPDEPEDRDGFEDGDGCPELDNDRDGVPDAADPCANQAEDRDGFLDGDGCPDPDNDGDGIPDAKDACANEPEDFDGYRDTDGCPDLDNDGDAIADASDQCPNVAEDRDGFSDDDGCPDPDNDGDGVGDLFDGAPNDPENINYFEDEDGVPEELPVVLQRVLGAQPRLMPGRAGKLPERALDRIEVIAAVLQQYPAVRVGIAVSADTSEEALSRATTIAARLVEEGVAPDRLEPGGEQGEEGVALSLVP
jgi:hypothetical protein